MPVVPFIPLIASGVGALIGSHGAKSAANAQVSASEQAAGVIGKAGDEAYNLVDPALADAASLRKGGLDTAGDLRDSSLKTAGELYKPFLEGGSDANKQLLELLNSNAFTDKFSFDPSKVDQTPGYQFTLNQGLQALQRAQAARGIGPANGGATKSVLNFANGLASTTYEQQFQDALATYNTNRTTALGRLGGLDTVAGRGASAARDLASETVSTGQNLGDLTVSSGEQLGTMGLEGARLKGGAKMDTAARISDLITGGGNAKAAGTVGAANAWTSALGSIGGSVQQMQFLKAIKGLKAAPTTPPFLPTDSSYNYDQV